jgi:hypothetical protein
MSRRMGCKVAPMAQQAGNGWNALMAVFNG